MLRSNRLILRELKIDDINETYLGWLNDRNVNKYLETRFIPQTMRGIKKYWEEHESDQNSPWFAICLGEELKHIGNIKLGPINWIHRRADISLFIGDRNSWGKGYASEAILAVIDWGFSRLNLMKINAGIYESNKASVKAFLKCGFSIEGTLREEVFSEGNRENLLKMGITKEDWIRSTK